MKHAALALLLVTIAMGRPAYGDSAWADFIRAPDASGLGTLLNATGNDMCQDSALPSSKERARLFRLIQAANEYAFHASLLTFKCFDVSALEDFYRASGLFLEQKPNIFMQLVTAQNVSDADLRYMVTMLPLSSVDDIGLQQHILNDRILLLEKVTGNQDLKSKLISYLEVAGQHLAGIMR